MLELMIVFEVFGGWLVLVVVVVVIGFVGVLVIYGDIVWVFVLVLVIKLLVV